MVLNFGVRFWLRTLHPFVSVRNIDLDHGLMNGSFLNSIMAERWARKLEQTDIQSAPFTTWAVRLGESLIERAAVGTNYSDDLSSDTLAVVVNAPPLQLMSTSGKNWEAIRGPEHFVDGLRVWRAELGLSSACHQGGDSAKGTTPTLEFTALELRDESVWITKQRLCGRACLGRPIKRASSNHPIIGQSNWRSNHAINNQSTDKPANQPINWRSKRRTDQPISWQTSQPTNQLTKQNKNWPTTNQLTNQPTNQSTDEAKQELTNQSAEKPANQPINWRSKTRTDQQPISWQTSQPTNQLTKKQPNKSGNQPVAPTTNLMIKF